MQRKRIAIIGAGPAGLTAAYLLVKAGQEVVVFEKDSKYVGGISRTESYKGYHFDIGGHRFFSKSEEVENLWTEILGDDMIECQRSSRIFYNKKFFSYPLMATEALQKLGLIETSLCVGSYLKAKILPIKHPQNFEEWVSNHFGKRLFNIFFKTYTEKVWGIPTHEISADWAAQRIKGLSLTSAIKNAFVKPKNVGNSKVIKTLIDTFRYPKYGPGMMWEACAKKVTAPMRILSIITYPFVSLLGVSTGLISKIFNIKPNESTVTEEEIRAIISEGTETGAIEETEQEIIHRVFHLGDRNITSLMTHRTDIVWMDVTSKVADIKQKMREVVHTSYPLCQDNLDNIKGLVSIKDILLATDETPLLELMKPGLYVPENNTVYQVMEKFKKYNSYTCFIVDEYGSLEGMMTLNDILEAIVGDIAPGDDNDYEIVKREDGTYLVDAQIPFYDFLSRFLKTDYLSDDEMDFNTLAGFVLHLVGSIPHTGEKFEWKEFSFEIIDMDGNRIDKILVILSEKLKREVEDDE